MTPALRQSLHTLANWCLVRSVGEHDTATTLTMLQRKVATLRARKYSHDTVTTHNTTLPDERSNGARE